MGNPRFARTVILMIRHDQTLERVIRDAAKQAN
jgi:hypothetical protein